MTNVPTPSFGPTGFIAPTEEAILAGVEADINIAFGGNINPALETPQGQLASSLTALIGQVNGNFVKLTNLVDPAFTSGRMQDAIARIYDIERDPSLPTVLQLSCSGLTGLLIPLGAQAIDDAQNIYICTQAGNIPGSGSVTLPFAAAINGPTPVPGANNIEIFKQINGWDSVTVVSGVQGQDTESASEFEARRLATVAHNSIGSLPSVLGEVLLVAGLVDAFVTENTSNSPVTINGVTLSPHSLYVAAAGGTDLDVASAIWRKKAPGCAYNGNTTVTVTDSNSGYSPPLPTYQVTFERPTSLPILFAVSIVNSSGVPSNAQQLIANAIVGAFAGADGGARARIASTLLASRYYGPVASLGPWAQISSLLVGSRNTSSASFTGSISGTTLTVTAVASGALAVGQTILDASNSIAPGSVITALGTGSGGTGTYTLATTQTISSESMISAKATGTSAVVNMDQLPVISAANVVVVTV